MKNIQHFTNSSKILECYVERNDNGYLDVVAFFNDNNDLENATEVKIDHCDISDYLCGDGWVPEDAGKSEIEDFMLYSGRLSSAVLYYLKELKAECDKPKVKGDPSGDIFKAIANITKPEIAA